MQHYSPSTLSTNVALVPSWLLSIICALGLLDLGVGLGFALYPENPTVGDNPDSTQI